MGCWEISISMQTQFDAGAKDVLIWSCVLLYGEAFFNFALSTLPPFFLSFPLPPLLIHIELSPAYNKVQKNFVWKSVYALMMVAITNHLFLKLQTRNNLKTKSLMPHKMYYHTIPTSTEANTNTLEENPSTKNRFLLQWQNFLTSSSKKSLEVF